MDSNRIDIKMIGDDKVAGYVDSTHVLSLRLTSEGNIVCDVSACIPHKYPLEYINVYQSCLSIMLRLLKLRYNDGDGIPPDSDETIPNGVIDVQSEMVLHEVIQRIDMHAEFGLGFALCNYDFMSTRNAIKREQEKIRDLVSKIKTDPSTIMQDVLRNEREMTLVKVRERLDTDGLNSDQLNDLLNELIYSNVNS